MKIDVLSGSARESLLINGSYEVIRMGSGAFAVMPPFPRVETAETGARVVQPLATCRDLNTAIRYIERIGTCKD